MSRKNAAKRTRKMLVYRNPSDRVSICFGDSLKLYVYFTNNEKQVILYLLGTDDAITMWFFRRNNFEEIIL